MKPPMKKPTPPTKVRKSPGKAPASLPTPGMNHATAMPQHDEMKYRAQDAIQTLKRAHEIQRDPELMKHVAHHAQIERDALKKIARKG